jgi:serine/threonine protein kinase
MENINELESIDSKYIIVDKKGHGATANVYLVREPNQEKLYAAKVLKEPSNLFEKEINILNTLKGANNPNIVNIISSGEGLVIRKNHPQQRNQYLVLEYAAKGELFNFIYCAKCGLREKYSKVIFAKILKGVQACHRANICHRDLKMQNILVDENFNPKICDFGFATQNNNHLSEYLGTRNYADPLILRNKPYDGFKADIFSLGVVLLTLTTCKIGFVEATKFDPYYRLIMTKNYEKYWAAVSGQISGLSQELKNLFVKMVAFKPDERPSIEQIFNSEWMREIREMNNDELLQLENEIKEEFVKREQMVNSAIKQEMEVDESSSSYSSGNRGANDENDFFDLSLKPKYAQTGLNMNNYIKLKGSINPCVFMNNLTGKIKNEFKDGNCSIDPCKDKLKLNVIFEGEQLDDEIPEDIQEELKQLGLDEDEDIEENDDIKGRNTTIQIKIYESLNGGYLLRFVKKEGDQNIFMEKMEKIYSLVKSM